MSSRTPQSPGRGRGKVRQACDYCRTQKIRCNGARPCANCTGAVLQCTYLAVHKKTGPKGPRRPPTAQRSSREPRSVTPGIRQNASPHLASPDNSPQSHITVEDSGFRPSTAVQTKFIISCLDAFFKHKYPITPVLDRQQTEAALPHLTSSPEMYGLLTACCAVIVLSPEILSASHHASASPFSPSSSPTSSDIGSETLDSVRAMPSAEFLVSETIRARGFCNFTDCPSLTSVQTSFFLFSAFFCLGNDNSAWFYLREAITLLQLLRLDEESTYSLSLADNVVLSVYSRRMFWVLFITERAYALQRHRALTLRKSIELPPLDSGPESHILPGFLDLISLFQHFDNDFFAIWNQSSMTYATSAEFLVRLQNVLAYSLPSTAGCTESQLADLLVSREWLKTMVWQLCVSRTLLSSSSNEESMSLRYPVKIARDVVLVSRLLPLKAFEANGVGILEKVFDIGCSLADVLCLEPSFTQPSALEVGPRDHLVELVRIVGTTLGGSYKHLQILASKAAECLQNSVDRPLFLLESNAVDNAQVYQV
ncbi:RING-3 protein [Coniochaeta ligniaria NRRL 30616]|uniref:RING-3 protein n=1 Tax=Coniochaeta ligniaria NRRL 30616 TaxID=1408157 RepID=A0A1J7J4M7_9PEZI|nr:RING-3 protein [Coniochaeta ligniaria NRRL 30616]